MKLHQMRAVLTGATGGIGQELAQQLVDGGAKVLLVSRSHDKLQQLSSRLGRNACFLVADITAGDGVRRIVDRAARLADGGGANVLINNAGTNLFGPFADHTQHDLETTIATNVVAPMRLSLGMLPVLQRHKNAAILNVGSILGSIGMPGQVCYSTGKFALHGFSEALRRELQHTSIRVLYCAPRATDTPMNTPEMRQLNETTGAHMDAVAPVVEQIIRQLQSNRAERFFGWPERLFVKLNALLPGLVDLGSRRTAQLIADTPLDSKTLTQTPGANS